MLTFLSNLISSFLPNESEYIEFWDNFSDTFTDRENFLMNLSPEDFWNIDFAYYHLRADLDEGWDYRLIEGYDESQDYI